MKKQLLFILSLLYVIPLFAQVPTITGFTPKRGGVGTTITITGTNFSTTSANNIVYFGGVKSPVLTATSTTITVKVPFGASYKRISVTTGGLTAWTREYFLPTFAGTGTIDASTLADNVDVAGGGGKIEIVDVDLDGKPEVVSCGNGSYSINFAQNVSTPGVINAASFNDYNLSVGDRVGDFTVCDADNDGKKDLVCIYYHISSSTITNPPPTHYQYSANVYLRVYKNQSTPGTIEGSSFAAPVDIYFANLSQCATTYGNSELSFDGQLESADLNLDGKDDLIYISSEYKGTCNPISYTNSYSSSVYLFQNSYSGVFDETIFAYSSTISAQTAGGVGVGITISNINTDSKPEIAVQQYRWYSLGGNSWGQTNTSALYRNNSSTGGAFSFTNALTLTANPKVLFADFNYDTKNDLFNGSVQQNNITGPIIDNTTFATAFNLSSGYDSTAFCDINGDATLDVCRGNLANAIVGLIPNINTGGTLSNGSFGTEVQFATYGGGPHQMACNDMDLDGKPDVVSSVAGNISIMRNQTPSTGAILNIGTVPAGVGSSVAVPVTATTLNGIEGFQFTVQYDQTKLSYQNCSDWDAGINSANVLVTNNSVNGTITFVYNDQAFSIASGTFFKINFNVIAGTTSSTPVIWSDNPTPREFINSIPNLIDVTYNNGTVNIVNLLYTISGTISYDNVSNTPMGAITVELLDNLSNVIATTTTNGSGQYTFGSIANGNYTVRPSTVKPWGGATSLDITLYKKHIGSVPGFIMSGIRLGSGDVNVSTTLTSIDLTLIKQRIGAQINSFTSGDWLFESGAVTVSSANITKNIKAICYGDANGSNNP